MIENLHYFVKVVARSGENDPKKCLLINWRLELLEGVDTLSIKN